MKLKKSGIFIVAVICGGLMFMSNGFGSKVYAAVKGLIMVNDSVNNDFSAGVNIDVNESFISPDNWNGDKVEKKVSVTNNGSTPAFIRVAIVPRWVDGNDNPWPGDVSSNVIEIEYSNPFNWIDGNDGYYYYDGILSSKDSTSNIIESVQLKSDVDKEKYKGKTLIVDVKAEAVEASTEAYNATWSSISQEMKFKLDSLLNIK